MTTVDLNRLRGNYAEHFVAEWLSRACLVRPVAEGTDIGLDLYCESLLGPEPYLHFWVQVKAIPCKNVTRQGDSEEASCRLETRHLRYWDRQPVPVYVLLVPLDCWPPSTPSRVYGIKITEYLVRSGLPSTDTVALKTSEWFDSKTLDTDLQQFLTKVVPCDTSALLFKKGIVAPVPFPEESRDKHYPFGLLAPYLDKVLDTIYDASVIGALESLMEKRRDPEKAALRGRFVSIASLFEDRVHPLGVQALALSAYADGQEEKARAYIVAGMQRIDQRRDLSQETKERWKGELHKLMAELDQFEVR